MYSVKKTPKSKSVYDGMRSRTADRPHTKSYKHYFLRGIGVCEEWKTYQGFKKWFDETYVEGLTLDRRDNDKGYSPENCRWVSYSENLKNRRQTAAMKETPKYAAKCKVEKAVERHSGDTKVCQVCKVEKSRLEFGKERTSFDGLSYRCQPCERLRNKRAYIARKKAR